MFEFLLAGKVLGHVSQGKDVAAEPEKVTLFDRESFVFSAEDATHSVDCL